jgi:short-subunit dehydrogenase
MMPPERVAAALVRAVEGGKAEVFVPRWLTLGARVHGAAPATFARLSRRFDPPAR